jgi:hypothetical protein
MSLLRKILFILAIILLLIAAIGLLFFPSHIHLERKIIINQSQKVVYDYVLDLKNWNDWSPWFKVDTNAKYTYAGNSTGVGSSIKWDSENKELGKGSVIITEAKPDSVIRHDFNVMEEGVAKSTFVILPEENGTHLIWTFDVDAGVNPVVRIIGSFMNEMVGKDFDQGLQNMKKKLEKQH